MKDMYARATYTHDMHTRHVHRTCVNGTYAACTNAKDTYTNAIYAHGARRAEYGRHVRT